MLGLAHVRIIAVIKVGSEEIIMYVFFSIQKIEIVSTYSLTHPQLLMYNHGGIQVMKFHLYDASSPNTNRGLWNHCAYEMEIVSCIERGINIVNTAPYSKHIIFILNLILCFITFAFQLIHISKQILNKSSFDDDVLPILPMLTYVCSRTHACNQIVISIFPM